MRDLAPLWRHYQDTILTFADRLGCRIDLRQTPSNDDLEALGRIGVGGTFAIVTACNPTGASMERSSNHLRTAILQTELERLAAPHVPVQACSSDGSHCEASFAVGLGLTDAVALAARHDQLAIFWFDGISFWIVPARSNGAWLRLPSRS